MNRHLSIIWVSFVLPIIDVYKNKWGDNWSFCFLFFFLSFFLLAQVALLKNWDCINLVKSCKIAQSCRCQIKSYNVTRSGLLLRPHPLRSLWWGFCRARVSLSIPGSLIFWLKTYPSKLRWCWGRGKSDRTFERYSSWIVLLCYFLNSSQNWVRCLLSDGKLRLSSFCVSLTWVWLCQVYREFPSFGFIYSRCLKGHIENNFSSLVYFAQWMQLWSSV